MNDILLFLEILAYRSGMGSKVCICYIFHTKKIYKQNQKAIDLWVGIKMIRFIHHRQSNN